MTTKTRTVAVLAVVAAAALLVIALVVGDSGRASAVGPTPAPLTETSKVTCHTNAAGYCTVPHALGQVPGSVVLTPRFYPGTTPYLLGFAAGTAATLQVRAAFSASTPVANADIEFSYVIYAGATVPTTTTTTTTTTPQPPGEN